MHQNPLDLISFLPQTLQDLVCYEPHQPAICPGLTTSAPEPSRTSVAICPGTRQNLISHLHQNPPEPHQPSAPEPSSPICPETLRNLISHRHQNPPEPHQPSAHNHLGTSSAICSETLRNLISHLHRNPPEPSGTLRNLLRNLVLQLHRIAPELFWARPHSKFCCWRKTCFNAFVFCFGVCTLRGLLHRERDSKPKASLNRFVEGKAIIVYGSLRQKYGQKSFCNTVLPVLS